MSRTLTEKILARAAGRTDVGAGEEIRARPDFVLAYELRGYTDAFARDMVAEFGVDRVPGPGRFAVFIDHRVPAKTPEDARLHDDTRAWCRAQDVALYDREGIGHQVAAEAGYAVPGAFVVHFDGHVSQLGAFGALALGLRANVLEAFVREHVTLTIPESVRVELSGGLGPGVMARDVWHELLRRLGPAFAAFQVVEFAGAGVEPLGLEGMQTITGLAMFAGAVSAIVPPTRAALAHAAGRARATIPPAWSDADAAYAARYTLALDEVEPLVAAPPDPANVRPLREAVGVPVHAGYLGSCVSGRLEDLRVAARVLAGRRVAPGFALHVVPTSRALMHAAAVEGLLATLVEAGAFVSSPSCDFCSGNIAAMAAGQRAVSTGTLNVPGRMGHPASEIYLCNAAVVAASAVEGRIADPRPYLAEVARG